MKTLTTTKGKSVNTPYTDQEAYQIVKGIKSTFAESLAYKAAKNGRDKLSADQLTWIHILACEATLPKVQAEGAPAVAIAADSVAKIVSMFQTAGEHLKYPKIRLQTADGQKVVLAYNAAKAKINVTDGGPYGESVYFGKIEMTGEFITGKKATEAVKAVIAELGTDPVGTALKYGQLTGNCCFCGKTLTDPVSVACGYGPVCALHFGLSHSAKSVTVAATDLTGGAKPALTVSAAPVLVPAAVQTAVAASPADTLFCTVLGMIEDGAHPEYSLIDFRIILCVQDAVKQTPELSAYVNTLKSADVAKLIQAICK